MVLIFQPAEEDTWDGGLTAPCVFDGPINGIAFCAYVDQILVPALKPNDIVIMDNLGSHKSKAVRDAIRAAGAVGSRLVENPDVRFIAFTGGGPAGASIQSAAGLRRTQMELGSISGTIVCADADIVKAASKSTATAFRKSGQVCTSLQRICIHESVFDEFAQLLTENAEAMQVGDPRAEGTDIGAMIHENEAIRCEAWVHEALKDGATMLTSRSRNGAVMPPTILTNVTMSMRVMRDEIFGPIVCLIPFTDVDAAMDMINDSPYGLAAGIFTRDIDVALRAARKVEVGLFNINNTSSNRADPMPYGGCKASGFGREGPRAAIRDMTDERLVTISPS